MCYYWTSFFTFLILLFIGIRKKRKSFVYTSLLFLFLTIGAGIWTGYLFASKAYKTAKNTKLNNPFKARTGREIYNSLFGAPEQNCVRVINYKDQVVPRLDCCIWLEFTTCSSELQRVMAQNPYKKLEWAVVNMDDFSNYSPRPEWFKPSTLGDNIIIMQHYNPDNPNRDQMLFFSKDSTHAFYLDMTD